MNFQREVLQNRNQWAVDDLKKAGLNPILAAGATNSSAAGATSQAENPASGGMSAYAASKGLKIQEAVAASEVEKNSALAAKYEMEGKEIQNKLDVNLHGSTATLNLSSADVAKASRDQIGAYTAKIQQETENLIKEAENIKKEGHLIEAKIIESLKAGDRNAAIAAYNQYASRTEAARTNLIKAQEAETIVERRRKELGIERGETYSRGFGYVNYALDIGESFLKDLWNKHLQKVGLAGQIGRAHV